MGALGPLQHQISKLGFEIKVTLHFLLNEFVLVVLPPVFYLGILGGGGGSPSPWILT